MCFCWNMQAGIDADVYREVYRRLAAKIMRGEGSASDAPFAVGERGELNSRGMCWSAAIAAIDDYSRPGPRLRTARLFCSSPRRRVETASIASYQRDAQ